MSVITRVEVTPNRIEILHEYLRSVSENGIARDDLLARLAPPSLDGGANIAQSVVREARLLGIAEETGDGGVRLADELRSLPERAFFDWIEARLLDPDQSEAAGQHAFPRALAWFLAQDPASPFEFGDNVSKLVEAQCGPDVDAFELTMFTRSQNFVYWAQYMGYAWRLELYDGASAVPFVIPDPTAALERHLPRLLRERRELPIRELLRTWAQACPVLESGAIREEVEALFKVDTRRSSTSLSKSTSLALKRLEDRGVIHLDQRADAPSWTLAAWPDSRSISHVVLARGR